MARTPAYWTNKKRWSSVQAVSQLSLSQVPHGFGAPYRGFPAFLSPSNFLKTAKLRRLKFRQPLVQSLNSPFFPPHIGAEPGRAKEESRITCMRMPRTPPFFPPKSGEKPYLEIFSRFCLWRDFLITYKQQFLHSD